MELLHLFKVTVKVLIKEFQPDENNLLVLINDLFTVHKTL